MRQFAQHSPSKSRQAVTRIQRNKTIDVKCTRLDYALTYTLGETPKYEFGTHIKFFKKVVKIGGHYCYFLPSWRYFFTILLAPPNKRPKRRRSSTVLLALCPNSLAPQKYLRRHLPNRWIAPQLDNDNRGHNHDYPLDFKSNFAVVLKLCN